MLTRLLLISDTHVPQRARALPGQVWAEIDRADVVVHAGDWNRLPLLDEIQDRASTLLAVRGNNDGPEFDDRLPLVARAEIERVRLVVVHETGSKGGREARLDAEYPDADLVIFGHSHIPWDSTSDAGLRILNPGSPTDRRREPYRTYLTLSLADGAIEDVRLHRLAGA